MGMHSKITVLSWSMLVHRIIGVVIFPRKLCRHNAISELSNFLQHWCMTHCDSCRPHGSSKTAIYGSFQDNCAGALYCSISPLHMCNLSPWYNTLQNKIYQKQHFQDFQPSPSCSIGDFTSSTLTVTPANRRLHMEPGSTKIAFFSSSFAIRWTNSRTHKLLTSF